MNLMVKALTQLKPHITAVGASMHVPLVRSWDFHKDNIIGIPMSGIPHVRISNHSF